MRVKGTARNSRAKATPDETSDAPAQAVPKSLDKATDDADRLAYLSHKYNATYERTNADGKVRVVLKVTGEGADNAEAIANLIRQLGAD
jgi:hypothetical protein